MATGYDEEGVEDIICASPPGASTGSRTSEDCGTVIPDQAYFLDEYKPNCWFWGPGILLSAVAANCAGVTAQSVIPGGTGTTDLCLEIWVNMRLGPTHVWSAAFDNGTPRLGVGTHLAAGPATGTGFGITHYGGSFRARFVENNTVVDRTGTLPAGWHHVAVNCERGVEIELFIDGTSQGVTAGVPNYTFTGCNINEGTRNSADHAGKTGPFALHSRLLTSAEIKDSVAKKYFQLNAETEYAYDVRDLVVTPPAGMSDNLVWRRIDNVNTGIAYIPTYSNFWSSNPNINVAREEMDDLFALWFECDSACPVGYIIDHSSNGRTIFASRSGYSTDMCFSTDPFWI